MTTVHDLYTYLDEQYPKTLSCPWDNDGLMCCGDREKEVRRPWGFGPLLRGDIHPPAFTALHQTAALCGKRRPATRPHPRILFIIPYYLSRFYFDCQEEIHGNPSFSRINS